MIECPNCNGNLKFNIESQKLSCSFCDSSYDVYKFDKKNKDGIPVKEYETTIFACPECAGEIESTDVDVTGFCPFCGASTIFYSRLSKELKPDYIIPFKKTKEDCKRLYGERARRAIFLPKEYKNPQYIDGFRGIYMPYWAFDVSQKGKISMSGEKSHRSGNYIIHDHYKLKGDLKSFYNGLNHDASSSFSDDISEKIAPFDIKEKKEFTAGFLSGFYADTADVVSSEFDKSVKDFANTETEKKLRAYPEFSSYSIENVDKSQFNTKIDAVKRTMFPVWFMSYRHNDRVAYATVNGQTGKVSADLPIDLKKYFVFSGVVSLIIFAILNMFFTIKPTTMSGFILLLSIVSLVIYLIEENKIVPKEINFKFFIPIIFAGFGIVLSFFTWISDSYNDELHYISASIAAICVAVTIIFLVKDYNKIITRPLPQFDKKGGDDRA